MRRQRNFLVKIVCLACTFNPTSCTIPVDVSYTASCSTYIVIQVCAWTYCIYIHIHMRKYVCPGRVLSPSTTSELLAGIKEHPCGYLYSEPKSSREESAPGMSWWPQNLGFL